MLEGKDFSDQQIMSATNIEAGNNGTFRLKIKLPTSGREVTSEWIKEEFRRKALFSWVDTIRGQIQGDAEDLEAERKAKILAERAAQPKPSSIVDVDGATYATSIPAAGQQSAPAPTAPSSVLLTNPDDYVAAGLKAALMEEHQAGEACDAAVARLKTATAAVVKWTKLHDTLKGVSTVDSSDRIGG